MFEFWLYVFVTAGIYTIFSLGLMVQFGVAGLPNFGNGAFMAISAYAMAILIVKLGMPMPVAAVLAIVASLIFGLLLALPTVRLRADYLAIATIAASEIVRYQTSARITPNIARLECSTHTRSRKRTRGSSESVAKSCCFSSKDCPCSSRPFERE